MESPENNIKEKNSRAIKMMLWLGIASLFMTFAGFTSAFIVSKSREDWITNFHLPQAFTYSLVVIIISSLSLFLARRELLKNTSLWVSGLLLTPSVAVLKSCNPLKREDKWKSDFFSKDSGKLIFELIDTLIPNTQIPGAIEAKVHEFVESYVRDVYNENKREWFIEELSNFGNKTSLFRS